MQCSAQSTCKPDFTQAYQGGCFVPWQTVFPSGTGMKGLNVSVWCIYPSLMCHLLIGFHPQGILLEGCSLLDS